MSNPPRERMHIPATEGLGKATRCLLLAVLGCAPAACGGAGRDPAGAAAGRWVAVVVADSLGAAHLGCYGGDRDTSPALDALARAGVRFERASSQTSWTLPSVASLLTGLEQERHGLRRLEQRLDEEVDTLAELYRAAGYRTAAVMQTPLLGAQTGLDRGFDRFEVLDWKVDQAARAVELALDVWSAPSDRPLFLYLHLCPPHMPYQPPPPFRGRFAGSEGGGVDGSIASARRIHKQGLPPDHPDTRRLAALYHEHVRYADHLVRGLVEGLGRGPAGSDGFLLVVTSDHGEAFMEHGSQGHNATVYEDMVHVPLILSGPGLAAGRVVEEPVSLLDLLPTLVELCELPEPASPPRGRSLLPLLRGQVRPARVLRLSSRYKDDFAELELALRRGRWKLVLRGASDRAELFDLDRDPGERRDLSASHPRRAAEMERVLRDWYAARSPSGSDPTAAPDEELARALRELGYLDER